MTVTIRTQSEIDRYTWFLAYESDEESPTFYIYLSGELYATTTATEITIRTDGEETPVIEISDGPEFVPMAAYSGRVTLCWYPVAATDFYRVQEYVDDVWVTREELTDNGEPYFTWITRWLEDVTEHQFRIVPVGTNGNDGTAAETAFLMVRYPDPPSVTMVYSNTTHKVTIAAATT